MNIMCSEMNRRLRRKFSSTVLAAVLGFTSIFAGNTDWISQYKVAAAKEEVTKVTEETEQVDGNNYGLRDNIQDGTILHCFNWKYNDIKEELPNIAAAGFTSVQTSPAQRDDSFGVWYMLYQPQTFSIYTNALGSKSDLQALCDEAEKYGINVIVDVVANHTRSIGDDGLGSDCYHHDGDAYYSDRFGITHGRIGMPDLNSEHPTVQNKVKGYIEELKGVGVDGIRWDAAKHISLPSENCQFWPIVTSVGIYNYGEILVGPLESGGEGLMKEYTNYMSVTDSKYGQAIREAFEHGGVPSSIGNWSERGVSKDKLVYWGESHDTYSNNGEYGEATQLIDQNKIDRAYAIVAGQGKASSLYFSRPHSTDKHSIMAGAKGSTHFTSKEIAAVNHLHNNCVGEKDYYVNGGSAAAVCRESGAVIVKGSGSGQVSIKNGGGLTAPGTYKDEVSGSTWTVTADTISGTVGESGIAVIYSGKTITKDPTVSVSKDSGTFTEAFDLTLTPSNATKATYSINGGDAVEFTSKKTIKIGEDCKIGDKVTVKVTATGEGEPFEKTFTYTMAEVPPVPEAKFLVRVKKSDFSTAPYIYAYEKGATAKEYAGEWPGTKLEDDGGDYYIFKTDDTNSATVILHDGGSWRNTQEGETEAVVTGKMEYDKSSNKFTEIKEVVKTDPPKTTKPAETTKPTDTPTQKPTKKPAETTKPTDTPTKKPTEKPVEGPGVTASLENGASFKTETQDVKLTFKDAKEVTYSVDGGPKKTVDATKNKDVTVTLGQGKIGNSEVTLEVESKNGSKSNKQTFKYKKEFVKSKGTAKALSVFAASVANKITETAETVNGAPGSERYATNPNGNVGARKTIASASDFTEDMIIAQGVANDDPGAFRGTHEAPKFDPYAMYGAWDDENLYIGIQYTNVIDVVDPAQQAPQTGRGKPNGADADIPQMLVFDTRSGDYTDGTANDVKQKTAWDTNVKFGGDAKVDKVFLYSPKDGIINQAFFPVTNGMVDYDNVVKSGYNMPPIPGVETTWEDGFFGSTMYGIKGTGYTGYKPADLESDSGSWVDFLSEGHSKEHDTFCIVKLPLSLLGVTASDIESNGIGVMAIATYGSSGIGSLPMDMTMLDVAGEAYSKDDSTSQEKEDEDLVTVSLAQLGKSNGVVTTKKPSQTKVPATTEPSETKTPATTKPEETKTPATKKPSETKTPATTKPTKTPETEKIYCVNFGADKSSPQYNTTKLTLKAEAFDGTEPYTYEFSVDGKVVQKASDSDSYTWKDAKAGEHTIKVVVKDKDGNETSSEKKYVIEEEKKDTEETAKPTEKPKETEAVKTAPPTKAPAATKPAKPTETPKVPVVTTAPPTEKPDAEWEELEVSLTTNKKSSQTKGTQITIYAKVKGGSGEYSYSFMVENEAGKITTLAENSEESSVTWTPSKAGSYKLLVIVEDKESGETESDIRTYKITNKKALKFNSFKASRKKVSARKKITLTASGTAGKGKVQYKFYYKKKGAKKTITIRKYSTKKKVTWKVPSKKGTYYVYCKIKDGSKKTLTKKVTIKVTKK